MGKIGIEMAIENEEKRNCLKEQRYAYILTHSFWCFVSSIFFFQEANDCIYCFVPQAKAETGKSVKLRLCISRQCVEHAC